MCLAIPMRIESIDGDRAVVEVSGTRRAISVALLEGPAVGDYVLVHAGFAIQRIDEAEAAETARLLAEFTTGDVPRSETP